MLKMKKIDLMPRLSLYILKWPSACVSCGSSSIEDVKPAFSRLTQAVMMKINGVETTMNFQVKTKLFLCRECRKNILIASRIPSKGFRGHGDMAEKLKNDPYGQFVKLTSGANLWVSEGQFKERLMELNPALKPESGKNPLVELRGKLPKDVEMPPVSVEEIETWPPEEVDKDKQLEAEQQEETETVSHLRELIEKEPSVADNWLHLVEELAALGHCQAMARVLEDSIKYVDKNTARKMYETYLAHCGDKK